VSQSALAGVIKALNANAVATASATCFWIIVVPRAPIQPQPVVESKLPSEIAKYGWRVRILDAPNAPQLKNAYRLAYMRPR